MTKKEQQLEALVMAYRDAYGDLLDCVDAATYHEFEATHGENLDQLWAQMENDND